MDDIFHGGVAGPCRILLPGPEGSAYGVEAFHKVAVLTQEIDHSLAHAGHDLHVDHHVFRVGKLYAIVRKRRAERPHAERNDEHRAPFHAALEQAVEGGLHLLGVHPVIVGAGVFPQPAADEGAVFYPCHIAGVGKAGEAVGAFLFVEADESAFFHQHVAEELVLFFRAVAPVYLVGLAVGGHFIDPLEESLVLYGSGIIFGKCGGSHRCGHWFWF